MSFGKINYITVGAVEYFATCKKNEAGTEYVNSCSIPHTKRRFSKVLYVDWFLLASTKPPLGRYPNLAYEETKAQKVQWLVQGSTASRRQMQCSNPGRLAAVCSEPPGYAVYLLDLSSNLCVYSSWYRTRINRGEFLLHHYILGGWHCIQHRNFESN